MGLQWRPDEPTKTRLLHPRRDGVFSHREFFELNIISCHQCTVGSCTIYYVVSLPQNVTSECYYSVTWSNSEANKLAQAWVWPIGEYLGS